MAHQCLASPYIMHMRSWTLLCTCICWSEEPSQCRHELHGPHLHQAIFWEAKPKEQAQLSYDQLIVIMKISIVSKEEIIFWYMLQDGIMPAGCFLDKRSAIPQLHCCTGGSGVLHILSMQISPQQVYDLPSSMDICECYL